MAFRVGQKVVCIWDDWSCLNGPEDVSLPKPRKGEVYTITDICDPLVAEGPCLKLAEMKSHCRFAARRFRPVHDTDISIFTKMLEPEPNAPVRKPVKAEG